MPQMLVINQVISRLDYCNSLYTYLPKVQLRKLQLYLHKSARLIQGVGYGDRVTPILIDLHWLPIKARIIYKVCCLVKTALLTGNPVYSKTHLVHTTRHMQTSSSKSENVLWKTSLQIFCPRAL